MKYRVVVEKTGTVIVEAKSGLEAVREANMLPEEDIDWDPWFEATDYEEMEETK